MRDKLRISAQERERCGAWRILPYDLGPKQFAQYKKERKNAKRRDRNRKAGVMPREEYLEFIRKPRLCEPWEIAGISRSTHYKRLKKARETLVWRKCSKAPKHLVFPYQSQA